MNIVYYKSESRVYHHDPQCPQLRGSNIRPVKRGELRSDGTIVNRGLTLGHVELSRRACATCTRWI